MILYHVEAPHFVAGYVVTGTTVTAAAPILKYLKGWSMGQAIMYLTEKGYRVRKRIIG